MSAVAVEWRKAVTTPTWWLLALCAFLFIALIGGLVTMNITGQVPDDLVYTEGGATHLVSTPLEYIYSFAARAGYVFPFLLGALLITAEYRHGTLSRSLLLSRSRLDFYTAKTVVGAGTGLAYGIAAAAVGGVTTAAVLTMRGISSDVGTAEIQGILLRTVAAFVLWALIGVGLGALLRNQAVTIGVVLLFTLFIEPTLTSMGNENADLNTFAKYLPGAASLSLVWPPTGSETRGMGAALESLGWVEGGLVLAAYAAVAVVAGYLVSLRRRDITS
ncbi:ABC transporter permease subunit [Georgenia sp. MJ206]|uniref:ABC transporter permease subunit n=1 Tax=Georgenia wangjunii TaxID=3117730 RepID=UPI002F2606BC